MKEFWYKLTGKMYLANNKTKTIHSMECQTKVCKLAGLSKEITERITWKKAEKLVESGYTFCKWCFRSPIMKSSPKVE